MSSHIMIDIEGLATTPDTTILTIAAQSFDPFGKGYFEDRSFYTRVTLESQEDRAINDETLEWWSTQGAAMDEAFAAAGPGALEQQPPPRSMGLVIGLLAFALVVRRWEPARAAAHASRFLRWCQRGLTWSWGCVTEHRIHPVDALKMPLVISMSPFLSWNHGWFGS